MSPLLNVDIPKAKWCAHANHVPQIRSDGGVSRLRPIQESHVDVEEKKLALGGDNSKSYSRRSMPVHRCIDQEAHIPCAFVIHLVGLRSLWSTPSTNSLYWKLTISSRHFTRVRAKSVLIQHRPKRQHDDRSYRLK